jgi:hypothetical protein
MARPIGEELARNPTAISRPKGGWFAKIWKQRTGSDPGNPSEDKIHLERANPFTLWVAGLKDPAPEAGKDSSRAAMPSKAFTLWTAAAIPENPFGEDPLEDSPAEQVIAPLPAGVFEEEGIEENRSCQFNSHAFTIWTTPEALISLPGISAGQLYAQGTNPEVEDQQDASVDEEVGQPAPLLIHLGQSSAFTRWTSDRHNSPANLQALSPVVSDDSGSGQQALDEPAPALGDAGNSSPGGGVARLVALAAMILLLISAMFVIAAKDKEISDLNVDAREEKKKMNGLKHDKQDLKGLLGTEQERVAGLEKKLVGLESDFTAANKQSAKESADQKAKSDELELNLKEVRAMLEESKKSFAQEQATRVQVERDQKMLLIDLESETEKFNGMMKKLEDAKRNMLQQKATAERNISEANKSLFQLRESMSETSKSLQEAKAKMVADKIRVEQSEKKAAQLAAEVKKLKAQVDELKSNPADPPAPAKPPEPKPGPAPDPIPEVEPKESPKDKPDKGPINV